MATQLRCTAAKSSAFVHCSDNCSGPSANRTTQERLALTGISGSTTSFNLSPKQGPHAGDDGAPRVWRRNTGPRPMEYRWRCELQLHHVALR